MNLSKNLTLAEMIHTDTGLDNQPSEAEQYKLFIMAQFLFQPIRDYFGPIRVSSGFRSEAVNTKVGGWATSQHMKAEAIDIVPIGVSLDFVFTWIKQKMYFGQCILYPDHGFIHVSMPRVGKKNGESWTEIKK